MKPIRSLHVLDAAYHVHYRADPANESDLCEWVDNAGGDHSRTYALELLDEGTVRAHMYAAGYPIDDTGEDIVREELVLHPSSPPPHWPQEEPDA